MKFILLIGFLFSIVANISAQKTITCKSATLWSQPGCLFSGVTISQNETVVQINTDPSNLDVAAILAVEFYTSSIYSIPPEIFTKFPNLKFFRAFDQNVQEIRPSTFLNAGKLELFSVSGHKISQLHPDAFKCKKF
jgi:hypothetical protein